MKVSVLVITYNHANFIAQAVNSVLKQETNFDYELIISEDCSTDSTRNIIVEFQKQYPGRIRLLLSEQNLNSNEVLVRGIRAARGQYIALLDGDDYWTSPHKLQRQVDFLAGHPECVMCAHDVTMFYEDSSRVPQTIDFQCPKEVLVLEDLLEYNFCSTCSVIFQRGLFDEFPEWYSSLEIGDYPLYILNAQYGKIGYIHNVMAAYRIHSGGVWSAMQKAERLQTLIKVYKYINASLNFKYEKIIRRKVSEYYFRLAVVYESNEDLVRAKSSALKCFIEYPFSVPVSRNGLFKLLLRLYTPLLFNFARTVKKSICLVVSQL